MLTVADALFRLLQSRWHRRVRRVRLRDGTSVILRPIGSGDIAAFRTFVRHLSAKSRYLRFHVNVTDLSEAQFRYLVSADGRHHVSVAAWKGRELVGMGCYFRLENSPEKAEVAFAVADALQRRGLGSLLYSELVIAARRSGIRSFRAEVLAENRAMRRLLRGSSPKVVSEQDGTIEVALDQESFRSFCPGAHHGVCEFGCDVRVDDFTFRFFPEPSAG